MVGQFSYDAFKEWLVELSYNAFNERWVLSWVVTHTRRVGYTWAEFWRFKESWVLCWVMMLLRVSVEFSMMFSRRDWLSWVMMLSGGGEFNWVMILSRWGGISFFLLIDPSWLLFKTVLHSFSQSTKFRRNSKDLAIFHNIDTYIYINIYII